MITQIYGSCLRDLYTANLTSNLRLAFLNESAVWDDTHDTYSDLTGLVTTGTGTGIVSNGTTGGKEIVLSGITTYLSGSRRAYLYANNIDINPATITFSKYVIYQTGTGILLVHVDYQSNVVVSGVRLIIQLADPDFGILALGAF